MATCDYCQQEMTTAEGCTDDLIVIDSESFEPLRYGTEWRGKIPKHCSDCNAAVGRVHHHGCDVERCPKCDGQSISCGCIWAGEEHLDEDWLLELEERFEAS